MTLAWSQRDVVFHPIVLSVWALQLLNMKLAHQNKYPDAVL